MRTPAVWWRMELHAQAVSDPDFAGLFFSILVAGACLSNQNVLGTKCRLYRQLQPPSPSSTVTVLPSGMPPRSLVMDLPTLPLQQHMDTTIAVSHPGCRKLLVPHLKSGLIGTAGLLTDGRPAGRERITSPPLTDPVTGLQIANQFTARSGLTAFV